MFEDQDGHPIEEGLDWWVTKKGEVGRTCGLGSLDMLTLPSWMGRTGLMGFALWSVMAEDMELGVEV